MVEYWIPKGGVPAKFLLLSVSAKNQRDTTRTRTLRIHKYHGAVRLPHPFATGPYVAAASTFTARKERSTRRAVSVP